MAVRPSKLINPKTGKPFLLRSPDRVRIRSRYDAAQTTDDNRRHWANADGLSSASANSRSVREILRNRSRYEYDNNGFCNGIIRTRADDLVGIGPSLQIQTEDEALSERIETAWRSWCKATCFYEKLHTLAQAYDREGEAFGLLVTNSNLNHPVQLDLLTIEADQVGDREGLDWPERLPSGGWKYDGIAYDRFRNPVSYTILKDHPGELLRSYPLDAEVWPARFVVHWFRRDRAGQIRGVPALTSALPLFAILRRWTLATLSAAETAASFAAVLESEMPPDDVTDEPNPFETLEIERGMMTTLPAGNRLKQFEAEHPVTNFGDFERCILNQCGRPVRMPSNVVSGDSSRHNFSSAKLDHFGYRGGLRVDRSFAEVNVLDKVYTAWLAEASLIRGYLPAGAAGLPPSWEWPGWPSMDKDEATNDTERLTNGTATLKEILAEWGMDWREVIRQRGRELRLMAEEGFPAPGASSASSSPSAPAPAAPESDEEDDDEEELEYRHRNGHARRAKW